MQASKGGVCCCYCCRVSQSLSISRFLSLTLYSVLFLLSAVIQLLLGKHHKKEKRYGPGPSNNYTSGSGSTKKPFWKRNKKTTRDAELGAVGVGAVAAVDHHKHSKDIRPSNDTALTGSTAATPESRYVSTDPMAHNHNGSHHRDAELAAVSGGALGAERHRHNNNNATEPPRNTNAVSNAPTGAANAAPDSEYVGYEPPEHRHYGGLPHVERNYHGEHSHATGQGNQIYDQTSYGRTAY